MLISVGLRWRSVPPAIVVSLNELSTKHVLALRAQIRAAGHPARPGWDHRSQSSCVKALSSRPFLPIGVSRQLDHQPSWPGRVHQAQSGCISASSPGDSKRYTCLDNLASSLQTRSWQWGVMFDLNEAIELNRAALMPRPPDHYRQSTSLNPLSMSLHDGFQQGVLSQASQISSPYDLRCIGCIS